MTMPQRVVGVDVAKYWIDAHDLHDGSDRRIDNHLKALKNFAKSLAGARVVFEASGGCERDLMAALEAAGVGYTRVNPRQAREFARATGRLAKTDRVDAKMLAQMGRALALTPSTPVAPARRRLAELVSRRQDLVAALIQERQRLGQARDAFVRRDIQALIRVLTNRLAKLDGAIAEQTAANAEMAGLEARLRSAPGVGPVTASVLIAHLPELGRLDRRAIASLGGLAPHACDSGLSRGKRRVWGGRADVRRALYLAAFIASRCDGEMKAFRQRLQERGKPVKLALIAVARKLLTILNALVREGRDYEARSA